ncbi:MAG: hypothetical protein AAF959_11775 [Cyanobacteria bacterium P01_D01_bin.56]
MTSYLRHYPFQDDQPGSVADGGVAADEGSADEKSSGVKDPEALANAYERTKGKLQTTKQQLDTLTGQFNELKAQADSAPKVTQEELDRLLALDSQVQQAASDEEEERLRSEKKWEELTEKRVSDIESTYQSKITLLEEKISSLETQLGSEQSGKSAAEQNLLDYKMMTKAQRAWTSDQVGGLPDAFDYAWEGDIKPLLMLDGEDVVVRQAPGSDNLLTDGNGNPISLNNYLTGLKEAKPFLYRPSNMSSGNGKAPSSTPTSTTQAQTINRSDLSNTRKMKSLASTVDGGDVVAAIREGKIAVVDD